MVVIYTLGVCGRKGDKTGKEKGASSHALSRVGIRA
jgi:hypothetical protein